MKRTGRLVALMLSILAAARAESHLRFVDITAESGITAKVSHGGSGKEWIAEANGSGAGALDFDNDGWIDVIILSGASMDDLRIIVKGGRPDALKSRLYLYRNLGNGKFADVTAKSGLEVRFWPTGVAAADYDNDGNVDILITAIGSDSMFRGAGDGTFAEVGKRAGISQRTAWHTGGAFGDYDNDGDLDLYIAGYLDLSKLPFDEKAPVCRYRGLNVFCGPMGLAAADDILYRNKGDGTFEDVSAAAGTARAKPSYGFTPVWEDLDQDGDLDLLVTNDSAPNFLFVNNGDGTFAEDALARGIAYNADGKQQADMGVAVGDYDGDGDVDILTTTFADDYFPLFEQASPGYFEDVSFRTGLVEPTMPLLGWSAGFADLDNDGDLDLWTVNGHVYPSAGELSTTEYQQSIAVFENRGSKFAQVGAPTVGAPKRSYRGGLAADFNNNGRVDLLAIPVDGSPILLENRSAGDASWIGFILRSRRTNAEAVGAHVEVSHCGQRTVRFVRGGGGYASRDDPRPHFGLGQCKAVEQVAVTWPDGAVTTTKEPPLNQWVLIKD